MDSHSDWKINIHPVTLLAYWGRSICIMFVICLEEGSDMLGREQGRNFCWIGDSITTRKLLPGMTLETDWKGIQLYFPEDFWFGTRSGFIFTPKLNIIPPGMERNIWMPMVWLRCPCISLAESLPYKNEALGFGLPYWLKKRKSQEQKTKTKEAVIQKVSSEEDILDKEQGNLCKEDEWRSERCYSPWKPILFLGRNTSGEKSRSPAWFSRAWVLAAEA